jgi:hypothetical protein
MSTTNPDGPYGSGFGSSPSMSAGSSTGSSTSTSSSSSTGSADTSESPLTNGNEYYGPNGSSYAASGSPGSSRSSTSSTSPESGGPHASSSSSSAGNEWSSGGSGYADTDPGALSRGAVTTRTGPMQRTSGSASAGPATGESASTGTHAAARRAPRKHKGPRRVRLAVARVDPWSVMKMSFLLSVALGIAGVVLTAVLWMILSTMNVFTDVEGVLQSLQTTTQDPFSIKDYVGFGRVVSLSIVIGVIDIILLTAISTVMAFLYNICSALVGGIQLTLTDD